MKKYTKFNEARCGSPRILIELKRMFNCIQSIGRQIDATASFTKYWKI
ncbi:MAG: hypothetical protein IPL09_07630 [Bacteroidetes bacterium]|nr:hypothetical protein [Bacteroidota bacterium]